MPHVQETIRDKNIRHSLFGLAALDEYPGFVDLDVLVTEPTDAQDVADTVT